MMPAKAHTKRTAQVGVRFFPNRRHRLCPGTAPSREKAKVIRDALVVQAIPQNSCPTVEISSTALAAAVVSAVVMIGIAVVCAVMALGWMAANVSARRTM